MYLSKPLNSLRDYSWRKSKKLTALKITIMNRKLKNNTKFTWVLNFECMPTEEMKELIKALEVEVKRREEETSDDF